MPLFRGFIGYTKSFLEPAIGRLRCTISALQHESVEKLLQRWLYVSAHCGDPRLLRAKVSSATIRIAHTKLRQNIDFQRFHFCRFDVVVVIIALRMQHAVHHQMGSVLLQ